MSVSVSIKGNIVHDYGLVLSLHGPLEQRPMLTHRRPDCTKAFREDGCCIDHPVHTLEGQVGGSNPSPRAFGQDASETQKPCANDRMTRPRGAARSARQPVTLEIVGSNPTGGARTPQLISRVSMHEQKERCCCKRDGVCSVAVSHTTL